MLLPTIVEGSIGLFSRSGTLGDVTAYSDGSSTRVGEGALAISSGALLGGGAPVGTSSLVVEVAGCVGASSMVGCSDGLEPPTVLGSTFEATLQIHSINHGCLSFNTMENCSFNVQVGGPVQCGKDPAPGTSGNHCWLHLVSTRLLIGGLYDGRIFYRL